MENILTKARSLVLTSDLLFWHITKAVGEIIPTKKLAWKDFVSSIAEAEKSNDEMVMISVSRKEGRKHRKFVPVFVFIEDVKKYTVNLRILFPLYGPAEQQDRVLLLYLAKLDLNLSVRAGGIVLEIILPFSPIEVKYGKANGHNGQGQRAFVCPEEVIRVS